MDGAAGINFSNRIRKWCWRRRQEIAIAEAGFADKQIHTSILKSQFHDRQQLVQSVSISRQRAFGCKSRRCRQRLARRFAESSLLSAIRHLGLAGANHLLRRGDGTGCSARAQFNIWRRDAVAALAGLVFATLLAIRLYSPALGILFGLCTLVPCIGIPGPAIHQPAGNQSAATKRRKGRVFWRESQLGVS